MDFGSFNCLIIVHVKVNTQIFINLRIAQLVKTYILTLGRSCCLHVIELKGEYTTSSTCLMTNQLLLRQSERMQRRPQKAKPNVGIMPTKKGKK